MHRFVWYLIGLGLLYSSPAMTDSLVIEVLPVTNRPVDEVAAIVRPLVLPPGSVSIVDNQLVVHSTPEKVAQIQRMLAKIDRAPKNLMVTVRYGPRGARQLDDQGTGEKQATTHPPVRYSTERVRDSQRVRVLEGREVYITTGRSVPVASNNPAFLGVGVVAALPGVEYRDVSSGFYARARLSGDHVVLEVSPHRAQLSRWGGGAFDFQKSATVVSGRPGEWIDLGGVDNRGHLSDDVVSYSTRGERSLQTNILVKVDILD